FVGMLLVWVTMIPCVPALVVVVERLQDVLPTWLRDPPPRSRAIAGRTGAMGVIAQATERAPRVFVATAVVITAVAAIRIPSFLRDPWEYDFDHLGSRGSKHGGAGEWSVKAEK